MTLLPDWSGRLTALMVARLSRQLRQHFPQALWHGNPLRRELALTFDDGPHPQDTPALLALLAHYEVRATFFMLGAHAAHYPHLVQAVAAAGHQIGIHGYHHRAFWRDDAATLRATLSHAQQVIAEAAGCPPSALCAVRPPYGHVTPALIHHLLRWGYQPVMWSIAPFHWMQSHATTVRQVLDHTENGALLVLHEGLVGPPIIKITYAVVETLTAAQYVFVTVDELGRAAGAARAAQLS
jgi:peptidoglycan/xylan/chitin deacetylase (PgdA/CDA1 family)